VTEVELTDGKKQKSTNKKKPEENMKIEVTTIPKANNLPPVNKSKIIVDDDDDDCYVEKQLPPEPLVKSNVYHSVEKHEMKQIETICFTVPKKKEPKLIPVNAKSFFSSNKIIPKQPLIKETPVEESKGSNENDIQIEDVLEEIANDIHEHMMDVEPPIKKDNTPRFMEEVNETKIEEVTKKEDGSLAREEVKNFTAENDSDLRPQTLSKQKRSFLETVNKSQLSDIPVSNLWTNKYNPTTISDIIGNQDLIKKLIDWLTHWNDVVHNGNLRDISEG
jgi:hypothetical protein